MAEALGPGIARPSLASGPYARSTYYLQVTTYYLLPTNYYLLHMRGMRVSRVRIVPAGEYTEAPSVSACLATMRAQGWAFCKRQVQSKKLETVFCWLPCGHRGGRFGKGMSGPKSWKRCCAGYRAGTWGRFGKGM